MSKQETNNKFVNDQTRNLPQWKREQEKSALSQHDKEKLGIEPDGEVANPIDYDHNPVAQENAKLKFDGQDIPPDQSPESVPDWKQSEYYKKHKGDTNLDTQASYDENLADPITREVMEVSEDIILNEDGTVANVPENIGKIAPVGRVLVVGDNTANMIRDPAKSLYQPSQPANSPGPGKPAKGKERYGTSE